MEKIYSFKLSCTLFFFLSQTTISMLIEIIPSTKIKHTKIQVFITKTSEKNCIIWFEQKPKKKSSLYPSFFQLFTTNYGFCYDVILFSKYENKLELNIILTTLHFINQ